MLNDEKFFCLGRQYVSNSDGNKPDHWKIMPNGDRVCSHCNSVHEDDFMRLCNKSIIDGDVRICPTDLEHKVHIYQEGVEDIDQGGVQFFMWHVQQPINPANIFVFEEAMRISREATDGG